MMSKSHVMPESEALEGVGPSFEERSVWIQLVVLSLVMVGYFGLAARMSTAGVTSLVPYVPLFGVATVVLIAVLVAAHVVAAIVDRPAHPDERDRVIEWRAESRSGWLLATGMLAAIGAMVAEVPAVWTAHLLLLSLFLSQLLKLALQLVDYRRGL
jgi:hypothetical protein